MIRLEVVIWLRAQAGEPEDVLAADFVEGELGRAARELLAAGVEMCPRVEADSAQVEIVSARIEES